MNTPSLIGQFVVEEFPDNATAVEIFKDIPYTPAYSEVTEEERVRAQILFARYKKAVADVTSGQMTRSVYHNERTLAFLCSSLRIEDLEGVTVDQALELACAETYRLLSDRYLQLAEALESRQTYEYRLF